MASRCLCRCPCLCLCLRHDLLCSVRSFPEHILGNMCESSDPRLGNLGAVADLANTLSEIADNLVKERGVRAGKVSGLRSQRLRVFAPRP